MDRAEYLFEKLAGFSAQSVEKAILNRISRIEALEGLAAQRALLEKTDNQVYNMADSIGKKLSEPYGLYNKETAEKLEGIMERESKVRKLMRDASTMGDAGNSIEKNKDAGKVMNMLVQRVLGRNDAQKLKGEFRRELPVIELLNDYGGNNPTRTTALQVLRKKLRPESTY
jgi:hypothetical protein